LVEEQVHLLRRERPEVTLVERLVEDLAARLGDGDGLLQQLVEVVHRDAAVLHDLDELVMLLLGALHPEDLVEQVARLVLRRQAVHLQPWAVHNHLPELAHLGSHVEWHGWSFRRCSGWCRTHPVIRPRVTAPLRPDRMCAWTRQCCTPPATSGSSRCPTPRSSSAPTRSCGRSRRAYADPTCGPTAASPR